MKKRRASLPLQMLLYALIARHRSFAYRVTKLLWGVPLESETFGHASWIFLRLLGVIYLIAFLSFGVQAGGIIGSNGISPAGDFLRAAREYFGTARFWSVPTLLWLDSGDAMIRSVWLCGAICAVLLLLGAKGRYRGWHYSFSIFRSWPSDANS